MRRSRTFAASAVALAAIGGSVVPASADPPGESATLRCDNGSYTVSGFGRGEPLHLTTGTSNYVVVYAQNSDTGEVLTDKKGQQGRTDIVQCQVESPVTGTSYLMQGFFTPRN